MRSEDILKAISSIGKEWTKQIKAEERKASAKQRRQALWAPTRWSLKDICFENMERAYNQASDDGRLPTHWRQIFYVIRPLCDRDLRSDRPLTDMRFKAILEDYLDAYHPGWDILRGARGVLKEPHTGVALPLSTMDVRNYLAVPPPDGRLGELVHWNPTQGARNRYSAVLICKKEGFDELLQHEQIDKRYDLALMPTKGISAFAARDLARELKYRASRCTTLTRTGL